MDASLEMAVSHLWLLDVDIRVLEMFRRDATRWTKLGAFAAAAFFRAEPFDASELGLGALWRPPVRAGAL